MRRECGCGCKHITVDDAIELANDYQSKEQARCLEIVEEVCSKAAETQIDFAEEASHNFSREKYIHGRRLALELSEEITKRIQEEK